MRDIKDASQGELSKEVITKMNSLRTLAGKLKEMSEYLAKVIEGKYRYNPVIIQNFQVSLTILKYLRSLLIYLIILQDIFNLLPNLNLEDMIKAFSVKSNDYMFVLYVSSLIKSVVSLHSLINNRIHNKEDEIEKAK